jgi:hypothetical protein
VRALKKRGYDEAKVQSYVSKYNVLPDLQLLTDSENLSKNATPFDEWIQSAAVLSSGIVSVSLKDFRFFHL